MQHAEEAGRILLQAQADLRSIRERLSTEGSDEAEWHRENLRQVVENAESELKLKAEAMLSTVVHGAAPLPSLTSYSFRADPCSSILPQPLPALQLSTSRTRLAGDPTRPGAAAAALQRHASAVNNPTSGGNRQYLSQRLGIQPPTLSSAPRRPVGHRVTMGKLNKVSPATTPVRPHCKPPPHSPVGLSFLPLRRDCPAQSPFLLRGKVAATTACRPLYCMHRRCQEKTASAKGVIERCARRDPHATPPIGPKDVAAGLFSLVNRGLVAAHVDLTPVRPTVTLGGTHALCMHTLGQRWRRSGGGSRTVCPGTAGVGTTSCPCPPSPVKNASAQGPVWSSFLWRLYLSFWVQCFEYEARPPVRFAAQPVPTPAQNQPNPRTFARVSPDVGTTLADTKTAQAAIAALPALKTLPPAPRELLGTQLPGADVAGRDKTPPGDLSAGRQVRGFEELMDTFSLHHYIVRNGTSLDSTPEFVSFQRKFGSDWGAVQQSVREPSPSCVLASSGSQLLPPAMSVCPCVHLAKCKSPHANRGA